MGSVIFHRKPIKPLTIDKYRNALARRVRLMLQKEKLARVQQLLRLVDVQDCGVFYRSVDGLPDQLIRWSEWLPLKARFPVHDPIPPEELTHNVYVMHIDPRYVGPVPRPALQLAARQMMEA